MYVGCKNLRYGRDENFVISDVFDEYMYQPCLTTTDPQS